MLLLVSTGTPLPDTDPSSLSGPVTRSTPELDLHAVDRAVEQYFSAGLSKAMKRTYSTKLDRNTTYLFARTQLSPPSQHQRTHFVILLLC